MTNTLLTLAWVGWTVMVQQAWLNLADLALKATQWRGGASPVAAMRVAGLFERANCPQSAQAVRAAFGGAR